MMLCIFRKKRALTVELEIEDHLISTDVDDDLDNFDWDQLKEPESTSVEDEDDPLGDFLAQMNK